MNWEQKLAAFNAICDHHLVMRKPGDWYVLGRVDIAQDGMLLGEYGNGATPDAAVDDHWQRLVDDLPADAWLKTLDGRYVRWNGFMWVDRPRKTDEAA